MVISIDFDGTFTSDPGAFASIVPFLKSRGHTVLLITQRSELDDRARQQVLDATKNIGFDDILFASGFSKQDVAQAAGYDVQFWMDDNPASVVTALAWRGQ